VSVFVGSRVEGKVYVAVRDPQTANTFLVSPLDPGYRYVNHSPTGFEWGYTGSGPAQLAFAILLCHFNAPGPALLFYQDFKDQVIAMINGDRWELSTAEVEQALARIRIFRSRSRTEKECPDST
jgi:Family of unknown function (DUF6166)